MFVAIVACEHCDGEGVKHVPGLKLPVYCRVCGSVRYNPATHTYEYRATGVRRSDEAAIKPAKPFYRDLLNTRGQPTGARTTDPAARCGDDRCFCLRDGGGADFRGAGTWQDRVDRAM